jgi:hypothetical protein
MNGTMGTCTTQHDAVKNGDCRGQNARAGRRIPPGSAFSLWKSERGKSKTSTASSGQVGVWTFFCCRRRHASDSEMRDPILCPSRDCANGFNATLILAKNDDSMSTLLSSERHFLAMKKFVLFLLVMQANCHSILE